MRRYFGANNMGGGDMKIREGAYYRTRGGDVVGPMVQSDDKRYPWIVFGAIVNSLRWMPEGDYSYIGHHPLDLISEVYVSDTPPADAPLPDIITDQPIKTLRDEFAMQLMKPNDFMVGFKDHAEQLYRAADAMMEARKK